MRQERFHPNEGPGLHLYRLTAEIELPFSFEDVDQRWYRN
jgi:hypothetical protein